MAFFRPSVLILGTLTLGNCLGTCSAAGGPATELTLDDIQERIRQHRELVRLCGPLAAMRALSLLGHDMEPCDVVQRFQPVSEDGVPLQDVLELCREREPWTTARVVDRKDLDRLPLPCILLVNEGQHCLVLESIDADESSVTVWDPSDMRRKQLSCNLVRTMWAGETIIFDGWPLSSTSLLLATAGMVALVLKRAALLKHRPVNQFDLHHDGPVKQESTGVV